MKSLILFCLFAVALCRPDSTFSKFHDINVDEVLSNVRLLKAYVDCLNGVGKCTAEANDLKKILPNVIEEECSGCSDIEKVNTAKLMKAAKDNLPEEYEKILEKYVDDKNKRTVLDEFMNKYFS